MLGKFKENGKIFTVNTPKTPRDWTNKLFNDHYMLELSQTMQGSSSSFVNFNSDTFVKKERHFYIKNEKNGDVFCPLYAPLKSELDSFESEYALGYQAVNSSYKGINVRIKAFVPKEGIKEIWTVTIENTTNEDLEISLFSAFSFEDFSFMGSNCEYNKENNCIVKFAFPGHAKYDDKFVLDKKLKYVYMHSNIKADSYDTGKYRFYGCDDITELPISVLNNKCTNTVTQGMESILGAMQHKLIIKPGELKEISFILGVVVNKEDIINETDININKEFDDITDLWNKRCEKFKFNTNDENLNYLANYWFKKQVTYLSRTNRFDVSSPVRNEMQDTMGYAFCEPELAFDIMKKVLKRQFKNGYIKQWNLHDGSADRGLSTLRHSDAPIWLIICFIEVVSNIIKDNTLYEQKVGFIDSDDEDTIMNHLIKAAKFMTDKNELGTHGICLMRDGDWTDPMNGVGRMGKGESVWNTMALIYAVKELNKITKVPELMNKINKMEESLNENFWDGSWYLAAIDDSGRKVGTNEDAEGKIFLNTQTWAVISGVAKGERLSKVLKSLDMLKTKCGYKLSEPPFSGWNEKWGKISIKQKGALENGAVYCHGSLFKAYGDYILGNYDDAMDTILKTIPTNPKNPDEINIQLPLYVPNYYFGIENENFGRSSCFYNTGSTSWILCILYRIFGNENNK